ncbi:hypothetical protein OESDEN_01631 [Oesophagostomum dentatum]|uniref:Uncharacterized protein n=1 Tax=Oesophagostomum dentatum TaxID=61180 RepID=A0A0B1TM88_OESDE|nr:hypothetical protein OESDEN_01631 [Oesophagostomum dentatum]
MVGAFPDRLHAAFRSMSSLQEKRTTPPAQEKDDLVDNIATGRRRYPAGNQRRMVSPRTQVSLPRNESRNDSILQDIADLSIPDRLPEAFGEDH